MSDDETPTDHHPWYKDAVIYQIHVRTFFDSNDDGIGDLKGLSQKLDHIASLGVNTIWLMPICQSPGQDDGYDVIDYKSINPSYGTLDDFQSFLDAAHAYDLRVIIELVLNHTSDKHPWFQRARRAPHGSPEHQFYVWSDDDSQFSETRIIFEDTEDSNWTWDPVAQSYYWHRFYEHQPDLNYRNPRVVEAILDVMHFWLDFGVDGFRLDAVPYLMERSATTSESLPETHEILKTIRASISERNPNVVLLAEANQPPQEVMHYFGESDECQMAFHFPLMPQIFMALAKSDRKPIVSIIEETADIPDDCQWATFLRNHDELSLEMVSEEEREELWALYAPDDDARINLGIRRRLAPLMEGDRRRIELLHVLLLSLPGSPVLYYGDEIGMGDNLDLKDRDGLRTPMQWSNDFNAGFSKSASSQVTRPVINNGMYAYSSVNVASQETDPQSLMQWLRRALILRSNYPGFTRGSCRFSDMSNPAVLAFVREFKDTTILCVLNLSDKEQHANSNDLSVVKQGELDLFGQVLRPVSHDGRGSIALQPYQYLWFEFSSL